MAQNQRTVTGPIKMDSRKFLGALNDSAQAKLAFFENKIQDIGRQAGKNWKLAALLPKSLYIEDTDTHQHFVAVHRREKFGKVVIEGITPIVVVENQKEKLFHESCLGLINAIESNDQRGMSAAFNKMEGQRFSSRAISVTGKVRTRDGMVRHINVGGDQALDEEVRPRLVAAIVEGLRDRVIIENGRVVGGSFNDGKPIKLPVTKWASHKLVARQMLETAKAAYWSPGFQQRILATASLIDEDKVEEAVKSVTPFLKENEEFTLLTRAQVKTLIENALAASGIYNQQLCDDTALLVYRANLRVNRKTIVQEWRSVAKKAQHPQLLENVRVLEKSKNFENTYDKFLKLVFEAISDREVTAGALATTLVVLRDRTPKIKESHELASKLNDLIDRLKEKEFDDNAIYEAEDFIATVQEELATGDDLQNFDTMPGDMSGTPPDTEEDPNAVEAGDDLADTLGAEKANAQPSIVINAPLISFGGEGMGGAAGGAPPPPPGDDEGSDEDLDALLGGADDEAGGEQDDLMAGGAASGAAGGGIPGMESRSRRGRPFSEEWDEEKYGSKPWENDGEEEDDEDDDKRDEDDDPYKAESVVRPPNLGSDYGTKAISDPACVRRIAEAMVRLAKKHGLTGKKLNENMESLALAGMEVVGMRVPAKRQSAAIDQVVHAFSEEVEVDDEDWGDKWADGDDGRKRIPGLDETDKFDEKPWPVEDGAKTNNSDDDHDDDPAESQYKWGTKRRRGGRNRSNSGDEAKIEWIDSEGDGVLGEMAGVRFIFDHGGADPNVMPVILSGDGAIEVPIPDHLFDSAFTAAGLMEGHNPAPFTKWLHDGIEQFRPMSENDMRFGPEDEDMDDDGIPDNMEDADDGMGPMSGGSEMDDMVDSMEDDMGEMEPQSLDGEMGGDEFDGDIVGGEIEGDDDGLSQAVARITASADGTISVEVDPGTSVNGSPANSEMGDMDGDGTEDGLDADPDNPMVSDEDDMSPVDSMASSEDDAEDDMGGESEDMPNFEDDGEDDMEGDETVEPPGRRRRPADDDGFGEDEDITSPKSSKYTAEVKKNPRSAPEAKLPPKTDDKLKGFETVKKGDKSGTNPPTAKGRSTE